MVLSNNDGCVVARSNEAKELGIKAGTPYFQLKKLFPGEEIIAFSSNYELYADITGRVMSLVRKAVPSFVRYSIDEGFCDLSGMEHMDLKKWGEELSAHIWRATRMPVSIGIAPTKTLAKMASHFAKHYKGYNHCCYIDTDEKRQKALSLFDIGEVWGIGRRYATKLEEAGNEDEDHDDFTFRKAFMMLQDEVGNVIILPRQLDYCYDVEQYHDVFLPEQADFLVEWFKAQKQMDESFTYYVDNQYDFFEDIISGNNVLTEKYEGSGRCRVVSVLTK